MIRTRIAYDEPQAGDGFRLLIMRKWPRGLKKEKVNAWERELGPSLALLEDWHQKRIEWTQFAQRYRGEMATKRDRIVSLAERGRRETITLLCSCKNEAFCHRSLLKGLIEEVSPS